MAKKRKKSTTIQAVPRRRKKMKIKWDISKNAVREIWGVIFAAITALSFLALTQQLGAVGTYMGNALHIALGQGAFIAPVIFGLLSLAFFASKNIAFNFTRFFGVFLVFFGSLGFYHTFLPREAMLEHAGLAGGAFGFAASYFFYVFFGYIGARIILVGIFVIGFLIAFPFSITETLKKSFVIIAAIFASKPKTSVKKKENKDELKVIANTEDRKMAEEKRKKFTNKAKEEKKEDRPLIARSKTDWEFPSLDMLSSDQSQVFADKKKLLKKAELIREKLMEFGVEVEMGAVNVGPTVTQFTLKPAEGIKLNKITNLKSDLALALSAKSIRIEAPIPGKNAVGIEIPNENRTNVHLRELLECTEFRSKKGSLRLPIGRDVAGDPVIFELNDMPHLLIAGATGSGKSVGMNTFLLSLLYQNSPDELKMILIDPKRVELEPYNGIPHLLTPVITDADKALMSLRWAVAEMMRRYQEMKEKKVRNIDEFNTKSIDKMPKIIIVIDELADLMMRQLRKETENVIARVAQMARAVGMHLIIATQRPSVDVITGLIKANIPTRISFAVTSLVDSRTILDSIGAEDLLGKGDMLYSGPSLARPMRVQGIYVSTEEVSRVTNRVKLSGEPTYDDAVTEGEKTTSSGTPGFSSEGNGDSDDLLEEAIELIRSSGKASASLLQRRLSVGYARAARILDLMEERGMIGPTRGAKPREIYM